MTRGSKNDAIHHKCAENKTSRVKLHFMLIVDCSFLLLVTQGNHLFNSEYKHHFLDSGESYWLLFGTLH